MSQTDPTDERKRASKSFVDLMKEGDLTKYRVGVGSWDYKIDFTCPLTYDLTNVTECINLVDNEGHFTDYDVGLQAAINILDTNPRNGTRIIIFLTDGWVDTYNRSLANEAASKGYKIYTIGMGLKAPADIYLKEIASFTNGEYKSVPTPSDLGDIYTDIAEEVLYTSAVRDIAVTEVLQHYFWVKDGTFTIQPDKITQNLDIYSTKLAVCTKTAQTQKYRRTWSKKEKRAYQRSLSGIKVAEILGKPVRLMTLTTGPSACKRDINRDFEKLKKRIRRKYGVFEYFKVRTNEGFGVLHILFRGAYISQRWLSKTWAEVHGGSCIVDLRFVRRTKKRLAQYLVAQYVSGQSFVHMSWSWKWVFRGFVRVWNTLLKIYRGESLEKILKEWKKILYEHCYKQRSIYDYLSEDPPPLTAKYVANWRYAICYSRVDNESECVAKVCEEVAKVSTLVKDMLYMYPF